METIIKMVSEKAGISEQQATTAVKTVVSFIKDKLPAGMGAQLENLFGGNGSTAGGFTDDLKNGLGGMFGK